MGVTARPPLARHHAATSRRRALPAWLLLNLAAALLIAHGYVATGDVTRWDAWFYGYLAFAAPFLAGWTILAGALALLTLLPGGVALVGALGPLLFTVLL